MQMTLKNNSVAANEYEKHFKNNFTTKISQLQS